MKIIITKKDIIKIKKKKKSKTIKLNSELIKIK